MPTARCQTPSSGAAVRKTGHFICYQNRGALQPIAGTPNLVPGEVGSRLRVVAAVLSATTLACTPEVPSDPYFAPVPVASSEAPLSDNASIALADEDTACVIDSYELRVHCSDRSGSVVGTFGREGEVPESSSIPSTLNVDRPERWSCSIWNLTV